MPNSPLPDTAALWKDVNALVFQVTEYTTRTLEVRTLLKRIEALKNADVGNAFLMLGSVYQLTGEHQEMREAFRKSAQYLPSYFYSEGILPCLMNMGYFSESQAHARVTANPTQGFFTKGIKHAMFSGIFQTLTQYIEIADKMKLEVPVESREQIAQANGIAEYYELTESTIGELLDIAGEVFRANRLIYSGDPKLTIWGFDEFEDVEPHICFDFSIARSPRSISDLRQELTSRVANSRLGHFPQGLSVRFSSADATEASALAA